MSKGSSKKAAEKAPDDVPFMTKLENWMLLADTYVLQIPDAGRLADILGIRPFYLPFMILMCIATFFGIFEAFFVSLMATVYPAYASFKAIRSPTHDDDKQWLTYWVAYSIITTVDNVLSAALRTFGLSLPPFFPVLKVVVLCWLSYFRGSVIVFSYLEPHLENAEPHVDRFMESFVSPTNGLERAESLIDKAAQYMEKFQSKELASDQKKDK
eukprot:GHVH01006998.1.p1 GENE.GHVH01006998.1~~GHVH01006998.1.p1  ORF type:complete len:213 (+),score=30.98 GHVH01006998.1:69-707(+)